MVCGVHAEEQALSKVVKTMCHLCLSQGGCPCRLPESGHGWDGAKMKPGAPGHTNDQTQTGAHHGAISKSNTVIVLPPESAFPLFFSPSQVP